MTPLPLQPQAMIEVVVGLRKVRRSCLVRLLPLLHRFANAVMVAVYADTQPVVCPSGQAPSAPRAL